VRDFSDAIVELQRRVTDARGYLRIDEARVRLAEL